MTFSEIQFIFNRAVRFTFSLKKLLLVFIVLALCGLMVVFFRGLAIHAGQWMIMSLAFMPFFLCAGILLSLGIALARIYHNEIKQKPVKYKDVLNKSWEVMIGASYFSIPIILSYLLMWMLMGIFILLRQIPGIGEFFGVILAFGPFLLNLGTLVLCVLNMAMLFFIAPIIALKGLNRTRITQMLVRRLKDDLFSNIVLSLIATFPLLFFLILLTAAAFMTDNVCYLCENPLHHILQWFFIMIPFTALLSPAIVFFFNFSVEAHVLTQKKNNSSP